MRSLKTTSDIMTQSEENTEPGDPSISGCQTAAETDSDTCLRQFVARLTRRLLTKCHILDIWTEADCVNYTEHLVNQTMPGLTVSEGFRPDLRDVKKVCRAVVRDLKRKYGGMRKLETVVLSQHPAVDAAIVQSLQDHMKEHFALPAGEDDSMRWDDFFSRIAIYVAVNVILIIIFA